MDQPSINYIELVALTKITAESTVERFGSTINSSFFDASNILATMKQKGLVDFVTAFPSQSVLKLTDLGASVVTSANAKAAEAIDPLDIEILAQLSGGRRGLVDLAGSVNVAQTDLAMHLFKLNVQQYTSYELANGNMNIYLSEKGFITVKNNPPKPVAQPQAQTPQQQQQAVQGQGAVKDLRAFEQQLISNRKRRKMLTYVLIILIIIAIVVFLYKSGKI